ncbi:MAG: response regulator [Alphaproteobacteria bacterium]|nr:response regulator [Alphaproteobacteria bacterium]
MNRILGLFPAVVGLALLLAGTIAYMWRTVDVESDGLIRAIVRETAETAAERIDAAIRNDILAFERMAARRNAAAAALDADEEWRSDARSYLASMAGLYAVTEVDADGTVRRFESARAADPRIAERAPGPAASLAVESALAANRPAAGPIRSLADGRAGFEVAVPLTLADYEAGALVFAIDLIDLVRPLLASDLVRRYGVVIEESGGTSATVDPNAGPAAADYQAGHLLKVADRDWMLRLVPDAAVVAEYVRPLARINLVAAGAFGLVFAIVGVIFLLTYRHTREMERTAAALQNRQRALDEAAIVSMTDRQGRIVYANDKFVALSGYPRAELIGQDHRMINSGLHSKEFFADMWRNIRAGKTWRAEIRNRTKQGEFYWVDSTIVPIVDQRGEIAGYTSIRFLITDRKRAEMELAERNTVLDVAQRVAKLGWASIDFDSGRRVWSDQVYEIFDFPKGTIISYDLPLSRLHPDDRHKLNRLTPDGPVRGERAFRLLLSNGEIRFVRDFYEIERDAAGKGVKAIIAVLDVTDIERARVAAESASRAKSDFLATMSHEIRTPLNGVLGMATVLRGGSLSAEQRVQVETILESGRSLQTIVNDVLDISKLEAGKVEIEVAPFAPAHDIESVVALYRPAAEDGGLRLACDLAPDLPKQAIGDSHRIRQVLTNLLGNAVKFTPTGGHVTVRATWKPDAVADHGRMRIAVEDSGIGIAPDKIERVFDRFSQADVSTTRRYGGTGLGLAIAKQLALLMGGDIGVESRLGQGSTFWFELPLVVSHAELAPPMAAPALGPLDILAAEDNPINQMVLRAMLEPLGHRLDIVDNGRAAVERLRQARYDVVLMDVQMPEMDGPTATQAIRAMGGDMARLPIIALTANAMMEQKAAYLAAGMDEHVAKPIDPAELLAAMARLLGRPVGETSAPADKAPPDRPLDPAAEAALGELLGSLGRL